MAAGRWQRLPASERACKSFGSTACRFETRAGEPSSWFRLRKVVLKRSNANRLSGHSVTAECSKTHEARFEFVEVTSREPLLELQPMLELGEHARFQTMSLAGLRTLMILCCRAGARAGAGVSAGPLPATGEGNSSLHGRGTGGPSSEPGRHRCAGKDPAGKELVARFHRRRQVWMVSAR